MKDCNWKLFYYIIKNEYLLEGNTTQPPLKNINQNDILFTIII
jgi:hypothetical protein